MATEGYRGLQRAAGIQRAEGYSGLQRAAQGFGLHRASGYNGLRAREQPGIHRA